MLVQFIKLADGELPFYDISETQKALVLDEDGREIIQIEGDPQVYVPLFEISSKSEASADQPTPDTLKRAEETSRAAVGRAVEHRIKEMQLAAQEKGFPDFNLVTVVVRTPYTLPLVKNKEGVQKGWDAFTHVGLYTTYRAELPEPNRDNRVIPLSELDPLDIPDLISGEWFWGSAS